MSWIGGEKLPLAQISTKCFVFVRAPGIQLLLISVSSAMIVSALDTLDRDALFIEPINIVRCRAHAILALTELTLIS